MHRLFLNPIQFDVAARTAGLDRDAAWSLYEETCRALETLTAKDIKALGVSRPVPPRTVPAAARSPLREALERQNAERAAAVEVMVLPTVAVTFCSGFIADVRIVN